MIRIDVNITITITSTITININIIFILYTGFCKEVDVLSSVILAAMFLHRSFMSPTSSLWNGFLPILLQMASGFAPMETVEDRRPEDMNFVDALHVVKWIIAPEHAKHWIGKSDTSLSVALWLIGKKGKMMWMECSIMKMMMIMNMLGILNSFDNMTSTQKMDFKLFLLGRKGRWCGWSAASWRWWW